MDYKDFFGIKKHDKTDVFLNRLSSLDEEYYFHIASCILGAIPTPFNKQSLNGSILSFFANEGNKRNAILSINDDERKILQFVSLMEEANLQQIEAFCNDMNHYVLVLGIENLCDRLLLFKTADGYVVNPLLEDDIMALKRDVRKGTGTKSPYVDSNVLRAVLTMLINGSVPQREANLHRFYKSGRIQAVFPQFEGKKAIRMFELIRKVIMESDAIQLNGSHVSLDRYTCRHLFILPTIDVCLSAMRVWYGPELEKALSKTLPVLIEFPMEEKRFTGIVSATLGDSAPEGFVQDLEALGLLNESNAGASHGISLNEAIMEPPLKRSALTIDSDLMVSYYGIPDEYDILYLFADVQKCDNLIVYAITKSSFSRALGFETSRDEIEKYLNDPKTNVVLEQWERAASRVKVYDGIVLKCTEEVSFLVHKLFGVSRNVIAELGDGVFLMKRSTEEQWRRVLSKALDLEDLPSPICENTHDGSLNSNVFRWHGIKAERRPTTECTAKEAPSWDDVRKELIDDANAKGCMTEELGNLIDAKRIVSTSQIGKAFKYEKLPTAGGFDFNAKLALIKKAIGRKANSNPIPLKLELLEDEVLAVPLEIQGSGSKAFLKAAVLPEGTVRTIPIGTIYQVTLMRTY